MGLADDIIKGNYRASVTGKKKKKEEESLADQIIAGTYRARLTTPSEEELEDIAPVKKQEEDDSFWSNFLTDAKVIGSNLLDSANAGILQLGKTIGMRNDEYKNATNDSFNDLNRIMIENQAKKGATSEEIQRLEELYIRDNVDSKPFFQEKIDKINQRMAENTEKATNAVTKKGAELAQSIGNNLVGMGVTAINPAAGLTYFIGSATGSYYDEGIQRGMSEDEAKMYGGIMGTLEGVTEKVLAGQNIKGFKAILEGQGFKNALKAFGIEIGENFIQEAVMPSLSEITAATTAGTEHLNYDFTTAEGWKNLGKDSLRDGIDGALSAILINGATKGVASATRVVNKMNNGQEVTQEEIATAVKDTQESGVNVEGILQSELTRTAEQGLVKNQAQIQGLQQQIAKETEELNKAQDPREKQIRQEKINGLNEELNELTNAQQITEQNNVETVENIVQKNTNKDITVDTANTKAKLDTIDYANNNQITELTEEMQKIKEEADSIGINTVFYSGEIDNPYLALTHEGTIYLDVNEVDGEPSFSTRYSHDLLHALARHDNAGIKETINELKERIVDESRVSIDKYVEDKGYSSENLSRKDLLEQAEEVLADYVAKARNGYEIDYNLPEDIEYVLNQAVQDGITEAQIRQREYTQNKNKSTTDNQGREVNKDIAEELKDSKVRDDKGNLLTVYHGTPNGGFTEFDISKRGTATDIHGVGDYGKGFYFTPVKEGAESYTKSDNVESKNPQVYETYLNLKNPLRLDVLANIQKDIRDLGKEYGMLNIPDAEIEKVYGKYDITEEQYDEMSTLYTELGDNWKDIDISEYGYDGIINEDRTEYVAFDPKQIKILNVSNNKNTQSKTQNTPTRQEIDNLLDIQKNKSGSEYARAFFEMRDKYGEAKLYKALNEAYSRQKAGNNEVVEQVEETIAPMQETMEQLDNKLDALQKQLTEMQDNFAPTSQDIVEQQGQEAFNHITDEQAPSWEDAVFEAMDSGDFDYSSTEHIPSPLDSRDIDEVGNRKVKAYQYENPEVKPFFQAEAQMMLYDLDNTIKGEKGATRDALGNLEYYGITRQTTEAIAYLKDLKYNYSYDDIRKGLNAIIEDDGKENNAISKRIEFLLDERLREGYTTSDGYPIPPNQDYINFLNEKQVTEYNKEAFNAITDEDVPLEQATMNVEPELKVSEQVIPQQEKAAQNENTEGKQRKWVGTSTESEVVNREILPDDLDQSKIFYQPITNKATLGTANARLSSLGYEKSVEYFNNQFLSKKTTVEDIALGERLIQEAIKNKDTKTAGELIQNIAILGTELGQKVQALSIIQRMTPEGQLKMLEKTINRGKVKGDKAFTDIELTQEMKDKILKTYNEDGSYDQDKLNEVMDEVKQEIADNMQVTAMDKINAWRYLSMLGNPKTHIRNLVSNVAMQGTLKVKNALARTIEDIAPIKNKTKTWKAASDEVTNFARQTALEMKDVISGDSKYSESTDIKAKRQIFKNKVIEKLANLNSDMLEKEDWWFSKGAFESSFREFLTANGISTEADIQNNPELIEKGKNYAVEQAQIATFRQYSWLANKIRDIESKNTATQIGVGAVLPFKKTPINIAKTGLSYSPLGFAKTLTYDIAQVKKGNMEASTLVDHIAQNTTGTALTLVGYMLAQAGFLNGAGDDDKEGKYDYQLGKQAYSINIGGNTYSLSWLSPVAMPLFVGANAHEQLVEGEEWNADVVLETLGQTLDPLSEMSFLSSLDSVLSSYDSGVQRFFGIGEAMAQNYVTQFVPTASSQLAATLDDTKRSTKVSGDSTMKVLEETYNKLIYKIPFLREALEPTTDIWGNEVKQNENLFTRAFENFIAPYSRKESIATDIDNELKDLYSQTGDNGLLPSIPYNYVNYDGEKYNMSAEEYTDYKKAYGQTANDLLEDLFRTTTYRNATSEERADMVNDVYDYARDEAKLEYLGKEGVDYTNATKEGEEYYKINDIKGAIDNDMTVDEYRLYSEKPEKYNFFKNNGISYSDYEGNKDLYNYAYEHQDKYAASKAITGDFETYYSHIETMGDFDAKDEYGNSVNGLKKERVFNYVNSLDLDEIQKAIMFKMQYPKDDDYVGNSYNSAIVQYVGGLDMTYEEMVQVIEGLGMTVDSDGNVYW